MKRDYAIDVPGFSDFYQILGVEPGVSFPAMKKAYYAKAKECHPDVNPEVPGAEAQFRNLVNAFDVLSDPDKRRHYDVYLCRIAESADHSRTEAFNYSPTGQQSIMDTLADDILEELIVSNDLPIGSTMQTLMLDLERTATFIAFREAKNFFAQARFSQALAILQELCAKGGGLNVLHHYYLARCGEKLRRWWLADTHYRTCISIGKRRVPTQHLTHVRRRLFDLRKAHEGIVGTIRNMLTGEPPRPMTFTEDEMIEDTGRVINQLLAGRNGTKRIGTDRQLK